MTSKGTTRRATPPLEPELERLVEAAASAAPQVRIEFRDRIAAHGAEAIVAMEAWAEQGRSPGFAIAVLEAVGKSAEGAGAASALRRMAGRLPDWADVAQQAVARIGAAGRPATTPRTSRSASGDGDAAAKAPPVQGPCIVPNRDGTACRNPGRHPVEGGFCCTPHLRAVARRDEAH